MLRLYWREDPQGLWLLQGKQHNGSRQRIISLDDNGRILTWCNDTLGKSSLSVNIERNSPSSQPQVYQWQLDKQQFGCSIAATPADPRRNSSITTNTQLIFTANACVVHFAILPTEPGPWEEVDPHYIYSIDAANGELHKKQRPDCISFQPISPAFELKAPTAHEELCCLLQKTVTRNTKGKVADIFFSGGVDSTVLAAIAAHSGIPTINLWNVSFAGAAAPDRLTSLLSYAALCKKYPASEINYYARDVTCEEHDACRQDILNAIYPKVSLMDFTIGSTIYFASQLQGRLIKLADVRTILAGYEDTPVGEITVQDLCCKPRAVKREVDVESKQCDRCGKYRRKNDCAARACRSCCRKEGLADAGAYFCRSHGVNKQNDSTVRGVRDTDVEQRLTASWPGIYEKSAPTICGLCADGVNVLCGNGADELFGGYSRYSTCEMHGSLEGWRKELILDLDRLWLRNFARDNRVVLAASNGLIDCQLPFFELEIIDWVKRVSNEDLWQGILHNEEFANNKALLREMCQTCLGLGQVAAFKKRAMQFGSRSASSIFTAEEMTSKRSHKGTSTTWIKKKNNNDPTESKTVSI